MRLKTVCEEQGKTASFDVDACGEEAVAGFDAWQALYCLPRAGKCAYYCLVFFLFE